MFTCRRTAYPRSVKVYELAADSSAVKDRLITFGLMKQVYNAGGESRIMSRRCNSLET
jgi:hypothetical protein